MTRMTTTTLSHAPAPRATEANGRAQPEQRRDNQSGYVNNSWRDHALTITVA